MERSCVEYITLHSGETVLPPPIGGSKFVDLPLPVPHGPRSMRSGQRMCSFLPCERRMVDISTVTCR